MVRVRGSLLHAADGGSGRTGSRAASTSDREVRVRTAHRRPGELDEEDRQCCLRFAFDPSIVQLCLSGVEDRQQCRKFEGRQVEVKGEWPRSPHMFRPIPSCQVHLIEMKQIPMRTQELSGVLVRKVFPGPPNYDSVEDGDYPEVGWILQLDERSRNIMATTGIGEIEIEVEKSVDEELLHCIGSRVVCRGLLRDAENAHHHTSLLLSACKVLADSY